MAENSYDTLWVERRTSLEDEYDLTNDMGLVNLSPGNFSVFLGEREAGDPEPGESEGDDDLCIWVGNDIFELFFGEQYPRFSFSGQVKKYFLQECELTDIDRCRDRLIEIVKRAAEVAKANSGD